MISLATAGDRFQSPFRTETGTSFMGVVQPIEDGKIYPDDYFYHRQILRVHVGDNVKAGDVVYTVDNRRYLLGDLDTGLRADELLYHSFQMYQCTDQIIWTREVSVIDPLTNLARGTGSQNLGTLWALKEVLNREGTSREIKPKEELMRILVGAPVKLGDMLGEMRVRKVMSSHGISVVEVQ